MVTATRSRTKVKKTAKFVRSKFYAVVAVLKNGEEVIDLAFGGALLHPSLDEAKKDEKFVRKDEERRGIASTRIRRVVAIEFADLS